MSSVENLILFARGIQGLGVKNMDFTAFDTKKIDEYTERAKAQWGKTEAYREFEQKNKNLSEDESNQIGQEFMKLFAEFGAMMDKTPGDAPVQEQVKKLQDYITEHFYTCTNEILSCLGTMYSGDGEFTENIDSVGGKGCAQFASDAIAIYCQQ